MTAVYYLSRFPSITPKQLAFMTGARRSDAAKSLAVARDTLARRQSDRVDGGDLFPIACREAGVPVVTVALPTEATLSHTTGRMSKQERKANPEIAQAVDAGMKILDVPTATLTDEAAWCIEHGHVVREAAPSCWRPKDRL